MRIIVLTLMVLLGCGDPPHPFGGVLLGGAAGTASGASGGAPGTGGVVSTGGTVSSGGAPGTGGATPTGGAPVGPLLRIWPVGDSITAGAVCDVNPQGDYTGGGWRAPLFARLSRRLVVDFVGSYANTGQWALAPGLMAGTAHDGHPGISAARVRQDDYLAAWLPSPRPDVVLLSLGANDVNTVEAGANIGALVDRIRALVPAAIVYVATPTPQGVVQDVQRAQIVAEVARRPGVKLVDMSNVLTLDTATAKSGDFSDVNLHPSPQGYAKMAARWDEALAGLVPSSPGTGGAGGAPAGPKPCDGLCTGWMEVGRGQHSGALGTDAVCHQVYGTVTSIACGNFTAPRVLAVNGSPASCTGVAFAAPPERNGGYCFVAPAGQQPSAYFLTY